MYFALKNCIVVSTYISFAIFWMRQNINKHVPAVLIFTQLKNCNFENSSWIFNVRGQKKLKVLLHPINSSVRLDCFKKTKRFLSSIPLLRCYDMILVLMRSNMNINNTCKLILSGFVKTKLLWTKSEGYCVTRFLFRLHALLVQLLLSQGPTAIVEIVVTIVISTISTTTDSVSILCSQDLVLTKNILHPSLLSL